MPPMEIGGSFRSSLPQRWPASSNTPDGNRGIVQVLPTPALARLLEYPRWKSGDRSGPAYPSAGRLLEYPRWKSGDRSSPAYPSAGPPPRIPPMEIGGSFRSSLPQRWSASSNTPDGNRGIVQVQPTPALVRLLEYPRWKSGDRSSPAYPSAGPPPRIPPMEIGGSFKSCLHLHCQDDSEPGLTARHPLVGFSDTLQRINFGHRPHSSKLTE
jgi:hypothetical protein